MSKKQPSLETLLIHAGEPQPRIAGAVVTPVFQSATYVLEENVAYDDVRYLRLNNAPNHDVLHAKLALLEGAEAALVTASGMAAISSSLLTLLKPGDHALLQRGLYGGTHTLFSKTLQTLGIEHTWIDGAQPETWAGALRTNTTLVYAEAITNPLLEVADFDALFAFATHHRLISVVDSTFAPPVAWQPLRRGADLVLHSASKYLNGHSDITAGVVAGRATMVQEIRRTANLLGGVLDPHACFLLQRGLKTLAVRFGRASANALALAHALHDHPSVSRVSYPGAPFDPQFERANACFDLAGAMLTFVPVGGVAHSRRLLKALRVAMVAPSLGGVETLVSMPAFVSHAGLSSAERVALGLDDAMIRVAVGIEGTDDLIEDFFQALE